MKRLEKLKIFFRKAGFKYKNLNEEIKHIFEFVFFIFEYGIVSNIILFALFRNPVTIIDIIAWGLIWYIVKYEVPKIRNNWRVG